MRLILCVFAVFTTIAIPSLAVQQVKKPLSAAQKKELKKWQGSWQAVEFSIGGVPSPADQVEKTYLVIKGSKFTLHLQKKKVKGTFSIDPGKSPPTVDATIISADDKKTKLEGIYRWSNGRRKACFALPNFARPGDFRQEKGYLVLEWTKK